MTFISEYFSDIYDDIYGDLFVSPGPDTPQPYPALLAPDVLKVTIDYLNTYLDPTMARAHSRVPNPRPDQDATRPHDAFVVVEQTGGPRDDKTFVLDRPQLTFDSYAPHHADAKALAFLCRAYVGTMRATVQQGVTIYGIHEFGGPALSPDPISGLPRYRWTTQVVARCIEIPLIPFA